MSQLSATHVRQRVGTAAGLAVGGLGFGLTLLQGAFDLGRSAVPGAIFSGVFDAQARALLDGHLWLDPQALGIEGFRHDGRTYTYFPPFPALLRLPVVMTTREFDGRLTLLSMALAWIVLAVMCTKLIWFLIDRITGQPEVSRRTAALAACFLAAATGGTFLTFDAASPWMYHEVYVWAVTGAIGALYWCARLLVDREPHAAFWLGCFALVTIGTRATEGWAICLTVVATGLVLALRPRPGDPASLWWRTLLAGAIPLACSIALNLAKFDAIYMFPLETQVWTDVSPQRRAALAANGGGLTGPQFFTTSLMAYLNPTGIRFTEYFPWVSLPATPPKAYGGAFYDQAYRTGSVTAFMPLMMLGFLVSATACFWPRTSTPRRSLRAPLIASVLMTGGVMGYGYYSNRYNSDFVPAMVLGGAIGTALLAHWTEGRRAIGAALVPLVAAGALFSIAAQMATGSFYQITLNRGEPLETYVALQQQLSAQPPPVRITDGFPSGGRTDELAVSSDCSALYLNTGDLYEPWVTVVEREQVIEMSRARKFRSGRVTILESRMPNASALGVTLWTIDLEMNADTQQARFIAWNPDGSYAAPWFDLGPTSDGVVRIGIRHATDLGNYVLDSNVGNLGGGLPARYLDQQVNVVPAEFVVLPDRAGLKRLGLHSREEFGPTPDLCRQVASRAGLPVL